MEVDSSHIPHKRKLSEGQDLNQYGDKLNKPSSRPKHKGRLDSLMKPTFVSDNVTDIVDLTSDTDLDDDPSFVGEELTSSQQAILFKELDEAVENSPFSTEDYDLEKDTTPLDENSFQKVDHVVIEDEESDNNEPKENENSFGLNDDKVILDIEEPEVIKDEYPSLVNDPSLTKGENPSELVKDEISSEVIKGENSSEVIKGENTSGLVKDENAPLIKGEDSKESIIKGEDSKESIIKGEESKVDQQVIDIEEDDDDLMVIEPEKAAELPAFKNKSPSVNQQFNQPAPVPHWGPESNKENYNQMLESERMDRIRFHSIESQKILIEISSIRYKLAKQNEFVNKLMEDKTTVASYLQEQKILLLSLKEDYNRSVNNHKAHQRDLTALKYGANTNLSQEERMKESKRRLRRLKLEQLQRQAQQAMYTNESVPNGTSLPNGALPNGTTYTNGTTENNMVNGSNSYYQPQTNTWTQAFANIGPKLVTTVNNAATTYGNLQTTFNNAMNLQPSSGTGMFGGMPLPHMQHGSSSAQADFVNQVHGDFQQVTNPYMADRTFAESTDIRNLIDNIVPDEETSEEGLASTPEELSTTLLKHQRIGLSWLLRMENSHTKGGILADDMGLGKTIQALALIVANSSDNEDCKTTLVVAPVSLLRQWKSEIEDKLKSNHQLIIGLYHSVSKSSLSTAQALKRYDIILTSYGTLSSEFSKAFGAVGYSPFYDKDMVFHRIILDEAQFIKNKATKASRAVDALRAEYRLCLTGTPMQNNVDELYPLIRFLKAKPYAIEAKFKNGISAPIKAQQGGSTKKGVERLQVLLKAICLRRTKDSLIDGQPILKLPKKNVYADKLQMDEEEMEQYKLIESNASRKVSRMLKTDGYTWSHILVLLTRLRQACLHTFLCELSSVADTGKFRKDNWRVLLHTVINLDHVVVSKLKMSILKEDGDKEPQSESESKSTSNLEELDLITDVGGLGVIKSDESIKGEESVNADFKIDIKDIKDIKDTKEEIKQDQESKSEIAIRDKNAEKKQDEEGFVCPLCSMPASYESIIGFPCGHEICEFCVDDFFGLNGTDTVDSDKAKCMSCPQILRMGDLIDYKIFHLRYIENISREAIAKQYHAAFEVKKMTTRDKILELARKHDGLTPSSKMLKIIDLIKKVQEDFPGEKIIVFSQFTSFFEILKFLLDQEKIPFLRYDGSMTVDKKDFAVRCFYNDDIPVMLTSLKAGNAGLTLTCASHVILCDPFWNPFVEEQAMARAHRLGQQREVHVHRILLQDTIEERIVKLQDEKKEIINAALDETGISKVSKLGRRELGFLFGLNDLQT